jgi:uncharacterized protein (DUF2235 family)
LGGKERIALKRLAMFLDGTWNDPDDNTNVWRSQLLVCDTDADGNAQDRYYEEGVGTKRFERIRGGALGEGLDANLRHAYQWLMSRYEDGDKIYLFGFSRGAYTARSLGGLIGRCGLLLPGSPFSIQQIFERYRRGGDVPSLLDLQFRRRPRELWSHEDEWLIEYSRRVEIDFIGVWDTVGALGIPVGRLRGLSRKSYYFHNTNPSTLYKHMYQALAVDENRKDYQASLWTLFQAKDEPKPTLKPDQTVEQRWFIGAHCNVGGGYKNDALGQIPLVWMLKKATDAGLRFKRDLKLSGDECLEEPVDSYAKFLKGVYRIVKLGRRNFRKIGRDRVATKKLAGWSHSVNESIDASVFERWRSVPKYRPKNLIEWANRHGVKPEEVRGDWTGSA